VKGVSTSVVVAIRDDDAIAPGALGVV